VRRALDALRRRSLGWEVAFALLAAASAVPLWLVPHPPLQDLPQHLAAVRVLFDFGDPSLHFADHFEIHLGRTQYVAYYAAAWLLAWPFGVVAATKILVTASLVGTPYAMRSLLSALGLDERHALLVLPLAWNAHLVLGFLNFVAAIPLALAGLAVAVRLRRRFTRGRVVALGALTLVAVYTHVVPFGFLGLGAALVGVGDGWRATLRRWAPLGPAAIAAVVWSKLAPAGQSTMIAAFSGGEGAGGPVPVYASAIDALREIPMWMTDVLRDETDEQLLVAWGVLVLVAFALGTGRDARDHAPSPDDVLSGSLVRRVALLAPLAALAYFVTPTAYDWIWPINARFPLLAAIFLVPALPPLRRLPGVVFFVAVATVSVLHVRAVGEAFVAFEEGEVGEMDEAIAAIPEGSRVAGLVFDRGSAHVAFSPFLHAAAWVQAERGGAVMFTFADFPHSPFTFKDDARPPRVPPRWEWMPERVDPASDLGWYEYVLVRGGPGRIARDAALYEPVFRGPRWSVWRRRS
jgi:hypothetical protein